MILNAAGLRNVQPKFKGSVNWADPLARGLVFCAYPLGARFYDAVSKQETTNASTPPVERPGIDGNKLNAREARGNSQDFPVYSTGLDRLAGKFSLFVEGTVLTNGGESAVVRSVEVSSTGDGLGMNFDDSAVITNGILAWMNNGRRFNSLTDALGVNSEQFRHRAMITCDGTTGKAYAKNALNTSGAEANLPNANTGRQTSILFGNSGACGLVLAYNRILSLDEYQALYWNPWRLVQFPGGQRRIYPAGSGAQAVSLNSFVAQGIYGADAVTPGAVAVSLNSFVAQGIFAAFAAASIYPVTLNSLVAQAVFGADTVTPGDVVISPTSVIGQVILGAFAAALGSTQNIAPGSVGAQGVSGAFTVSPGAVAINMGSLSAVGVDGAFTVSPGSVTVTLNGQVGQGVLGNLVVSYVVTLNGVVAQATLAGLTVAVGPVTITENSIIAQTEFGTLIVSIPGGAAQIIQNASLWIGLGIRM